MPECCSIHFTGWYCPKCGLPISFADHGGSTPISIGSISTKNVTINQQLVQGDLIQAGGIKSTGRGNEVPESFELPASSRRRYVALLQKKIRCYHLLQKKMRCRCLLRPKRMNCRYHLLQKKIRCRCLLRPRRMSCQHLLRRMKKIFRCRRHPYLRWMKSQNQKMKS